MPQIHWIPGSYAERGPTTIGAGRAVGEVGGGPGSRYVSGGASAARSTSGTTIASVDVGFSEQFEIELDPGTTECTLWAIGILVGAYFARASGNLGLSLGSGWVDGTVKAKVLEGSAELITFDFYWTASASARWTSDFEGDRLVDIRNKQKQVEARAIYTLDIEMQLNASGFVVRRYFSASAEGNTVLPPPGVMSILFVR